MIDERSEEQANLYVLGVLTSEETHVFESALSRDAELQQFVATLRVSRDALAGCVPQVLPPAALKQKILAQIGVQEKVMPLPGRNEARSEGWMIWLPWALAACLAILCTVSLSHQKHLRGKIDEQAKQMVDLNQVADSLRNQTQNLKEAVATLQETNRLANLRIAMMGSLLADSPKAVAVSLWDDKQQRGIFVVQNLKPLPADKDYQLWVIDPKYPTPVSAGVFQVDAQGNVRLQFKADKLIESASKFAVTQEPKGGLLTPTLKNLVLIGG
jgi:anti-sigma-K factor RskA